MSRSKTDHESVSILDEYLIAHQEFIDSLPNPAVITDMSCNVIFTNAAMKRFSIDISALCDQLFRELQSNKKDGIELYIPSSGNYFLVYTSPVTHEKKAIGRFHSFLDITEIKNQEKEHRELVDIYAHAVNDIKAREQKAQTGREAFFNMLEDINESYKELEQLFLKMIRVMINALDAKSPWTKGHSERVSLYAEQIAREMQIDSDEIKNIRLAGLLHDIGKIGTYDYLLDKPGRLTPEEYEIVKKHPAQGAAILKDIKQLTDIVPLIEYHHEKIDGTGYPYGMEGEKIPLGAKILHVADSFDSMTSDRPYRIAPGIKFALSELHKHRGTQFDTTVIDAFLKVLEKQIGLSRLNLYSG